MILRKNHVETEITERTVLVKFPNGEVVTDGKFIWVNVSKVKAPSAYLSDNEVIDNCVLRLKIDSNLDTKLIDVRTFFKYGFIDGTIGAKEK